MEGDVRALTSAKLGLYISIHSLRMEGDDDIIKHLLHSTGFQSTPSAWRETGRPLFRPLPVTVISIHSLRMEGDHSWLHRDYPSWYFNPLPPHGGRKLPPVLASLHLSLSLHPPRVAGEVGHSNARRI